MPTGYISVTTVVSDFTPSQDGANVELEVKRGQMLLLLSKYSSRPGWWKVKIKTDRQGNNGMTGLVRKANIQEATFISSATASRDFTAEINGDLTITEHEALLVYCVEGDWALVKGAQAAGYVPRGCIKLEEEMDQAVVLFDYQATESEQLSLRKGETLIVLDREHDPWWLCRNSDQEIGVVPRGHIEVRIPLEEQPTVLLQTPLVEYDFLNPPIQAFGSIPFNDPAPSKETTEILMKVPSNLAHEHDIRSFVNEFLRRTPRRPVEVICSLCVEKGRPGRHNTKPSNLQRHLYAHFGIKSFACPDDNCTQKYTTVEQAVTHAMIRHSMSRPDAQGQIRSGGSALISRLVAHGYKDLTPSINLSSFSKYPIIVGRFHEVYRGHLSDGTIIAVTIARAQVLLETFKCLKASRVQRLNCASNNLFQRTAHELLTWSKCSHRNVLPLLGLALFRDRIVLVSPWVEEGDLLRYLSRTPGVNRYKMCIQVCEGLLYLHSIGIIHGNLKAANILVSIEGAPLLGGFGSSQIPNRTMDSTLMTGGSSYTLRWAAPELLIEASLCTKDSDVYALGMTLYEVMTGNIPYHGKPEPAVFGLVVIQKSVPERPESIPVGSPDADKQWELLLRCWSYEPSSRPSAGEVVETMAAVEALLGISRKLAAQEVVSRLVAHGCQDISNSLDLSSFSEFPISHGGNSDVYQGKLCDHREVAVKVLRVSMDSINQLGAKHLKASLFINPLLLTSERAARELHTWSQCTKHANIMPLLGLAVFRDRIGMVAPWMKNGSLPKYLEKTPGANRHNMCIQICEGLSYLHLNRIVHCDLKGVRTLLDGWYNTNPIQANVLVSDEGAPLLTDFGTSLVSDRSLRFTGTTSGLSYTLRWTPAEILNEASQHTEASDVYALGMTIYVGKQIFIGEITLSTCNQETIAGNVPYHGRGDPSVILKVNNREFPERPECMPIGDARSDKLWELLVRCWSYEPEARPGANEVTETLKNLA